MSKPVDEMSDDEKRLTKEFDKKLAIYNEEQEKSRKSLETELRKLQSVNHELAYAFDLQLKELQKLKLQVENDIFQNELKIIKIGQVIINSEDDSKKEAIKIQKLQELKREKMQCSSEIPEIKKELEKCREDLDGSVKREKDIERQFKKDFAPYEFYIEPLTKLFKTRTAASAISQNSTENLSPFANCTAPGEAEGIPLVLQKSDIPEGLPIEIWNNFCELRDRRIIAENESMIASRQFHDIQILVQTLLGASEVLRNEIDRFTTDIEDFSEYKFQNMYNVESFFKLKQGQIEIPQAPIVTDFGDAILIHRSVVENLNEQVTTLGQSKVEALNEIKEYRKGIHSLEWLGNIKTGKIRGLNSKLKIWWYALEIFNFYA